MILFNTTLVVVVVALTVASPQNGLDWWRNFKNQRAPVVPTEGPDTLLSTLLDFTKHIIIYQSRSRILVRNMTMTCKHQ